MEKKKRNLIIVAGIFSVLLAASVIFYFVSNDHSKQEAHTDLEYYCPMHPQVESNQPGVCPICNMDLIKKGSGEKMTSEDATIDMEIGEVYLSPNEQVLANVRTILVESKSSEIVKEVNGYVKERDDAYRIISSPVNGKLNRLYIRYEDQIIGKGSAAFQIYSPELISTQKEYLLAYRNYLNFKDSPYPRIALNSESNLEAARSRLKLWLLSNSQINALEERGSITSTITYPVEYGGVVTKKFVNEGAWINAGESIAEVVNLSSVWVIANFYEYEASDVKVGQTVQIRVSGYEINFVGKIEYINPFVDPSTRTLEARITLSNPNLILKPGMYVKVFISKSFYVNSIVIPKTAVLRTGKRDIVYIRKNENTFLPIEVIISDEANENFIISKGLNVGEEIVVSGGFLIDSESKIKSGNSNEHHGHDNRNDDLKINEGQDVFKDMNHKH